MNDPTRPDRQGDDAVPGDAPSNIIEPLPGEAGIPNVAARQRTEWSGKGLLALGVLTLGLVGAAGLLAAHLTARSAGSSGAKAPQPGTQPAAATAQAKRLELPEPGRAADPAPATAGAAPSPSPRIPALLPGHESPVEPIGVRRTGSGAPAGVPANGVSPEDAPVMLVSTRPGTAFTTPSLPTPGAPPARSVPASFGTSAGPGQEPADPNDPMAAATRNLQGYQLQLQGLLETLTRTAGLAGGTPAGAPASMPPDGSALIGTPPQGGLPPGHPQGTPTAGGPGAGLFGGQLQGSATPRAMASMLGNRSLTLPKGTAFTCALKTKVISATSGLVGCLVQRNVYSDDGRVLLIERGSHIDGEYRISSVRPGTVRIPVLWTRIRTPLGVTVDVDSPGTGALGESGIDGYVDNRWGERLGAAMLLSLIDDSVKLVIQNQANSSGGDTIVLPSTTSNTSKLAEKVLDSTINIPPLVYQNQGGIVGIVVARDVDFSQVYELRPTAVETAVPVSPEAGR